MTVYVDFGLCQTLDNVKSNSISVSVGKNYLGLIPFIEHKDSLSRLYTLDSARGLLMDKKLVFYYNVGFLLLQLNNLLHECLNSLLNIVQNYVKLY